MFRRGFKRRKPRVLWLPNPGTATAGATPADVTDQWAGIEVEIDINPLTTAPVLLEAPLVQDKPPSVAFEGSTLAVWQNSGLNQTNQFGWRLRRVVGDLFCSYGVSTLEGAQQPFPAVIVEAGIIVRRVDQANGNPVVQPADEDPGTIANNSDPWVWRRNWILGIGDRVGPTFVWGNNINAALARYPSTNVEYGSAGTGARVDQKTNRLLGPEERLFLNASIRPLPIQTGSVFDANVHTEVMLHFDYRILGQTFTAGTNRRNASR